MAASLALPQSKNPRRISPTGVHIKSLAVTYSCMAKDHTTIGAERFHFRVRKGIGWFPLAMAARQTGSRTALTRGRMNSNRGMSAKRVAIVRAIYIAES